MREEERLKRISNVEVMKEEMKKLKEKRTELNKLKSNEFVKRFLKLSEELEDEKILTIEEIKKRSLKNILVIMNVIMIYGVIWEHISLNMIVGQSLEITLIEHLEKKI